MDDDVAEIDEDPVAVGVALDARYFQSVLLDLLADAVRDGSRLNLRASRDDDELVGEDRASGDVDLREIFRFFVERRRAYDVNYVRQCQPPGYRLVGRRCSSRPPFAVRWASASE